MIAAKGAALSKLGRWSGDCRRSERHRQLAQSLMGDQDQGTIDRMLQDGGGMVVIRRHIIWKSFGGSLTHISGDYHYAKDDDEHYAREIASAIRLGWTARKWWKFWRYDDTPNPPAHIYKKALALTKEPTQ